VAFLAFINFYSCFTL